MFNIGDVVEIIPGCNEYGYTISGARGIVKEYRKGVIVKVVVDFNEYKHLLHNNGGGCTNHVWPINIHHLRLVFRLTKEQKLLHKINKLYKACPTTKHWVTE